MSTLRDTVILQSGLELPSQSPPSGTESLLSLQVTNSPFDENPLNWTICCKVTDHLAEVYFFIFAT